MLISSVSWEERSLATSMDCWREGELCKSILSAHRAPEPSRSRSQVYFSRMAEAEREDECPAGSALES